MRYKSVSEQDIIAPAHETRGMKESTSTLSKSEEVCADPTELLRPQLLQRRTAGEITFDFLTALAPAVLLILAVFAVMLDGRPRSIQWDWVLDVLLVVSISPLFLLSPTQDLLSLGSMQLQACIERVTHRAPILEGLCRKGDVECNQCDPDTDNSRYRPFIQ